jgi:hypothetical protein
MGFVPGRGKGAVRPDVYLHSDVGVGNWEAPAEAYGRLRGVGPKCSRRRTPHAGHRYTVNFSSSFHLPQLVRAVEDFLTRLIESKDDVEVLLNWGLKRQPCGSWLNGLEKPNYVRTPWRHRIVAFCLLIVRRPLRTRGHLCRVKDHVSPFWYIRGVTPHSLIRRW